MEHHNQLADLKVRRRRVAAFGAHTVLFAVGKCIGQVAATPHQLGCLYKGGTAGKCQQYICASRAIHDVVQARGCLSAGLWWEREAQPIPHKNGVPALP